MKYDEEKLLKYDAEELSAVDTLVVLFMGNNTPIMKTRLQKLSLLYNNLYGGNESETDHNAYFFGGYSDDIDESATNLVDSGILRESRNGYELTEYGSKLKDYIKKEHNINDISMKVDNINRALSKILDKNVVGLTYRFYEGTAINSTIKDSVDRLNRASRFNGRPLLEVNIDEFEEHLREGKEIIIK